MDLDPSTLGVKRAGVLNLLAFGWITQAEAAHMLECSPVTVWRWCRRLHIDPQAARTRFLARLDRRAERYSGRRRK